MRTHRAHVDGTAGGGVRPRRRCRGLAVALALLLPATAACSDLIKTEETAGTRYGTAAALAQEAFGDGADVAVVTTGTSYPDALAAGPLAAAQDAPILLTGPDELPEETADALEELDVGEVVLLGGEAAIAPGIEERLSEDGHDVSRIAGADRYETAAQVATQAFPDGTDTAVIVAGDGFADALAAAPLADSRDAPILLTAQDGVPPATAQALESLGVSEVLIVGGEAAIGPPVEFTLGERYQLTRYAGADRYETAALLAREAFADGADTAVLVTGSGFADALAAAPLARERSGPMLLTAAESLPDPTAAALEELGVGDVVVVGGEGAVGPDVVEALEGQDLEVSRIPD